MNTKRSEDLLATIRRIPLFSGLREGDLRAFLGACSKKQLPSGAQLFSPDMPADWFYVIIKGRMKVYQLSAKGDEQILHIYGPGQTIGEAAMWSSANFPAHAEAMTDALLLVITRQALEEAITRKPELALEMMAGMSAKLREFNQLIEQLSLREVPSRLAAVLLQMSVARGSNKIRLQQTKRELAAQIGTVSETLSRALAKLKSAGLVEVDGSEITLLDIDGLRDLAES